MREQVRIYTINKGALDLFAAEWEEKIRPLREKLGFVIVAGWTVAATNQFIWALRYEGEGSFEEADQAYFASDERRTMDPDPARLIARMEQYSADRIQ